MPNIDRNQLVKRIEHLERQRDELQRCNNDETERRRRAETKIEYYDRRLLQLIEENEALHESGEKQTDRIIRIKEAAEHLLLNRNNTGAVERLRRALK